MIYDQKANIILFAQNQIMLIRLFWIVRNAKENISNVSENIFHPFQSKFSPYFFYSLLVLSFAF